MAAMALPPSDTIVRLSVGTTSRRYEVVEDVVIKVSTQFKFPNLSPRMGRCAGAKKKVEDGGRGLKRSKSCGEGRWKAPAHGVGEKVLNKHNKERKTRHCCGHLIRCGALCLLLPALPVFGFRIGKAKGKGKGKGKDERKEEAEVEAEAGRGYSSSSVISISISRRVSLEKFECGSWASSGMVVHNHDSEDSESGTGSLYFDLPIELIRNSVGVQTQSQSPVKAAFVFDREHRKGVWGKAKSVEESRSGGAASPCIITPRLHKAREEFNELLEAHAHTL